MVHRPREQRERDAQGAPRRRHRRPARSCSTRTRRRDRGFDFTRTTWSWNSWRTGCYKRAELRAAGLRARVRVPAPGGRRPRQRAGTRRRGRGGPRPARPVLRRTGRRQADRSCAPDRRTTADDARMPASRRRPLDASSRARTGVRSVCRLVSRRADSSPSPQLAPIREVIGELRPGVPDGDGPGGHAALAAAAGGTAPRVARDLQAGRGGPVVADAACTGRPTRRRTTRPRPRDLPDDAGTAAAILTTGDLPPVEVNPLRRTGGRPVRSNAQRRLVDLFRWPAPPSLARLGRRRRRRLLRVTLLNKSPEDDEHAQAGTARRAGTREVPAVRFTDVTAEVGHPFRHFSGARRRSSCPRRWAAGSPSSTTTATASRTSCSSTAARGPASRTRQPARRR